MTMLSRFAPYARNALAAALIFSAQPAPAGTIVHAEDGVDLARCVKLLHALLDWLEVPEDAVMPITDHDRAWVAVAATQDAELLLACESSRLTVKQLDPSERP